MSPAEKVQDTAAKVLFEEKGLVWFDISRLENKAGLLCRLMVKHKGFLIQSQRHWQMSTWSSRNDGPRRFRKV